MTTDPIALLRDAENYLSALHGSVARHDHLAANLACAGCELRDRIAAALPELAAVSSAVVAPPTDQAAEVDRLRAKVYEWQGSYLEEVKVRQEREAEITRLHADRAAVLRQEADRIDATRADFPIAVQNGITWATAEMRRHAADEQPGARHVHITIHHPDPTTANTAALCIADLVRGEYGDSLRLTITTDAGARQDGTQQ